MDDDGSPGSGTDLRLVSRGIGGVVTNAGGGGRRGDFSILYRYITVSHFCPKNPPGGHRVTHSYVKEQDRDRYLTHPGPIIRLRWS